MRRNGRTTSPESVDALLRNQWTECSGISGRLGPEYALVSAWGDFDPIRHFRFGDSDELLEDDGLEIVPADWNPTAAL